MLLAKGNHPESHHVLHRPLQSGLDAGCHLWPGDQHTEEPHTTTETNPDSKTAGAQQTAPVQGN